MHVPEPFKPGESDGVEAGGLVSEVCQSGLRVLAEVARPNAIVENALTPGRLPVVIDHGDGAYQRSSATTPALALLPRFGPAGTKSSERVDGRVAEADSAGPVPRAMGCARMTGRRVVRHTRLAWRSWASSCARATGSVQAMLGSHP